MTLEGVRSRGEEGVGRGVVFHVIVPGAGYIYSYLSCVHVYGGVQFMQAHDV